MAEHVDPFVGGAEPSAEQLAPEEGDWYQPYPERPRLRVLPRSQWPTDLPAEQKARWKQRFYVMSDNGTVGLVPWPGSQVVWPWEAGWRPRVDVPEADWRKRDLKQ